MKRESNPLLTRIAMADAMRLCRCPELFLGSKPPLRDPHPASRLILSSVIAAPIVLADFTSIMGIIHTQTVQWEAVVGEIHLMSALFHLKIFHPKTTLTLLD